MIKKIFLSLFIAGSISLQAQEDDLLGDLQDSNTTNYATASFKTSRVINGHSLENVAKGVFDFKISHRFSTAQNGIYDVFGLDAATIRIGGDYGVTEKLMVGVGRSTLNKTYDGYVKYKLLRQSTGKKTFRLLPPGFLQ